MLSVKVIYDFKKPMFISEGLHNASTEANTWEENDSRQFNRPMSHHPINSKTYDPILQNPAMVLIVYKSKEPGIADEIETKMQNSQRN